MVHTPQKKSKIPVKIIIPLTLFMIVGCVLVAGCSIPSIRNTKIENSSSPAITPSIDATTPAVMQTTVPDPTETSTELKKGQLDVSVGDYTAELPVFVDEVNVGNVSRDKPLNLTTNLGRHSVRVCVASVCNNQDVMVLSSSPTTADFADWVKNDIVKGPLTVSIGGYNAELPVLLDNGTIGNVSQGKQLSLMVSEGNHTVKVCVGILCVNETVEVKFATPRNIEFEEQLRKIAEFPTPTVRILDSRLSGSKVTVDLEFINPTKNDLSMTTVVQCAYSYIDGQKGRKGNAKQITVTRSVKAGNRTKSSSDIWLDGGRSYMIEIPNLMNTTFE